MNRRRIGGDSQDIPKITVEEICAVCMRGYSCLKHKPAEPMNCPHQFFKIADETKKEGEQIQITVRWGVKIMCALCGQRRILWTDGEVEVLK